MSSTDSGESGDDSGSDFELSNRDTRHDYEGYEEPDSDSDISTEEEEEEACPCQITKVWQESIWWPKE